MPPSASPVPAESPEELVRLTRNSCGYALLYRRFGGSPPYANLAPFSASNSLSTERWQWDSSSQ